MKPVSADGRLFSWKISAQMVKEHPLFGAGIDKFKSMYMYRQAGHFSLHPASPFAQIADDINVPFSEPLKMTVEQGLTGIAIFR